MRMRTCLRRMEWFQRCVPMPGKLAAKGVDMVASDKRIGYESMMRGRIVDVLSRLERQMASRACAATFLISYEKFCKPDVVFVVDVEGGQVCRGGGGGGLVAERGGLGGGGCRPLRLVPACIVVGCRICVRVTCVEEWDIVMAKTRWLMHVESGIDSGVGDAW